MTSVKTDIDTGAILDEVERTIYLAVKPFGFRRYGRTLHRFVSGDISQVIHFQTGPVYRGETHLLFVNTGIRVPECMSRSFLEEDNPKKYYQEFECNIRSRLGTVEGKKESCYDLREPAAEITADILRQIMDTVLPVFEDLHSRDAILARRKEYPRFDRMNDHLILLEEAMIHGRLGHLETAEELFRKHYRLFESGGTTQKNPMAIRNHLKYLDELAARLGFAVP